MNKKLAQLKAKELIAKAERVVIPTDKPITVQDLIKRKK